MRIYLATLVLAGCGAPGAAAPLVASLSAPGGLLFGMALVGVVIGAQYVARYRQPRDGGSERAGRQVK